MVTYGNTVAFLLLLAIFSIIIILIKAILRHHQHSEYPVQEKNEPEKEDCRIMACIHKEMTDQQAYREAGLTIDMLAERLGIHRNKLSKAINSVSGQNFNQYVNSFRIKEAIRIIAGTHHNDLYIDELYEKVGFGNRTSFYRVFKQSTGVSPRDFQKHHTYNTSTPVA